MDKHELYHQSFQNSQDYAYILDADGRLFDCNQKLLKALSQANCPFNSVGAIYKLMLEQQFGNEQQLLQLKKTDIDVLMNQHDAYTEHPVALLMNKKSTLQFRVIRTPLKNLEGQTMGLLVSLIDVTENIILKEQLDKVKAQLMRENAKINDSGSYSSALLTEGLEGDNMESPSVLLVEDDEMAQKAAKSVLLHCNFDVHIANGEQAFLETFKPGMFQLVLLDIGLENTSGYVIAKTIRKMEKDSGFHVPIVAVTGYDPIHLAGDCAHYTMEGAIQKPLTIEQVAQMNQRYIKNIDIAVTGMVLAKPFM